MFKWLLTVLAFLFPIASADNDDYVGRVAAEAAYASLLPNPKVVKPKVPTKDCTTCNGTGRVRTGDDQNWTKCPDCEGPTGETPEVKIPKSEPDRYTKPPVGTSLIK